MCLTKEITWSETYLNHEGKRGVAHGATPLFFHGRLDLSPLHFSSKPLPSARVDISHIPLKVELRETFSITCV